MGLCDEYTLLHISLDSHNMPWLKIVSLKILLIYSPRWRIQTSPAQCIENSDPETIGWIPALAVICYTADSSRMKYWWICCSSIVLAEFVAWCAQLLNISTQKSVDCSFTFYPYGYL